MVKTRSRGRIRKTKRANAAEVWRYKMEAGSMESRGKRGLDQSKTQYTISRRVYVSCSETAGRKALGTDVGGPSRMKLESVRDDLIHSYPQCIERCML
jgi:hypothetical protein